MLVLTVLGCFFSSWIRIYFFGSDPDFRPLRIRTKKKKFDPNPEKNTRIRNTAAIFALKY